MSSGSGYLLLLCAIVHFTLGDEGKCVKNAIEDKLYPSCWTYNYKCNKFSDAQFHKFLGAECTKTCKYVDREYDSGYWYTHEYEKSLCYFIQEINIISSPLFQLPPRVFQDFKNLEKLLINNATLREINDHVFYDLNQLILVDLSYNQISHVDAIVFQNLPGLKEIDLSNNLLENFTMTSAGSLEKLHLNDNRLKQLRLNYLSNLYYLDLNNNSLKNIDIVLYETNSLKQLSLSRNNLDHLTSFGALTQVTELDVSYNNISWLDEDVFSIMVNLERVYLQNNNLTQLSIYLFRNNSSLRTVSIANNSLTDLEENLFSNLIYMTYLDLSHNMISKFNPNKTFGSERKKHILANTIKLDFNHLNDIDLTIFERLNTDNLNISHNRLLSLNVSQILFDLDASFNSIEQLYYINSTVKYATEVYHLKFSNNMIKYLGPGIFHAFKNLDKLSLDHNLLSWLPHGVFSGLERLTYLNLGHNSLKDLHPAIFISMPRLETLILSYNDLHALDMTRILEELPKIEMFDIDFNKWECDYLYSMLSINNKKLSVKQNEDANHMPYKHNVQGVTCFDHREFQNDSRFEGQKFGSEVHEASSEDHQKGEATNNTSGLKDIIPKDIYDRLNKLELSNIDSLSVLNYEEAIAKYENSNRVGIIIILFIVISICLYLVYSTYENRRWRQIYIHRTTNVMMEEL